MPAFPSASEWLNPNASAPAITVEINRINPRVCNAEGCASCCGLPSILDRTGAFGGASPAGVSQPLAISAPAEDFVGRKRQPG